jgi:hypothetical protein
VTPDPGPRTVHNLTVEFAPTYFIDAEVREGWGGIWVHNSCGVPAPGLHENTIERILSGDRGGSGSKADPSHRAAAFLTAAQLRAGQTFRVTGGDGSAYTLLQTTGELTTTRYGTQSGIYEYMVDGNGTVTHQRFIAGGVINGIPNQRVVR